MNNDKKNTLYNRVIETHIKEFGNIHKHTEHRVRVNCSDAQWPQCHIYHDGGSFIISIINEKCHRVESYQHY